MGGRLEGQMVFARTFVEVRDLVEDKYYAGLSRRYSAGQLRRRYVLSMVKPLLGRALDSPVEFYDTWGRLMRHAWLSLSFGLYDAEHRALPDPATRLAAAQVNTVDLAWEPAMAIAPGRPLLVDVGTGRGNSVARLALAHPGARLVTLTLSPEQAEITRRITTRLGIADRVDIRVADVLDPAATADLVGRADGVTAIEVAGHFPADRTVEGFQAMAALLKPGAPLTLMDPVLARPATLLHDFAALYTWRFRPATDYQDALRAAGLTRLTLTDFTDAYRPTWGDTGTVLAARMDRLRAEFGTVLAHTWQRIFQHQAWPLGRTVHYARMTGYRPEGDEHV
ncbi:SAM-dependent methyltransferase [Actinokineospora diospyrosa]|uniref:Cyclopropane fatty-acyl-phospholipid synthase n=1 Tax=Actinokineospora diospyrosa TaxID=103728 RepID=A0ABT1IP52_9PSEU|nr:class I SAM-dependent methyltransferase [Actinokineospora diospyrosa]MCP2273916.1 Cyclopropane fatty-acyl-phospholipid synthase [Actinokineospora diospyrosa]